MELQHFPVAICKGCHANKSNATLKDIAKEATLKDIAKEATLKDIAKEPLDDAWPALLAHIKRLKDFVKEWEGEIRDQARLRG
jgi:hypothetical protein